MDISSEIAAIQAASQGSELRQPIVNALTTLNSGILPAVTSSDAGKILKVGANGWEVGEKSGYMPVPSASLNISSNGTHDVANYAEAVVNVQPSGKITITQNGTDIDVANYASADVIVPGAATLIQKSITQNGTYNAANDSADGYSSVTVNVPLSSVYAFVHVIYNSGSVITATDGIITLTSDTSGDYIFAIPNSGTWIFSDGSNTKSKSISEYGQSITLSMFFTAVHISTKSAGGNDAALYIQTGTWHNNAFVSDGTSTQSLPYNASGVQSSGVVYKDIVKIKYGSPSLYWACLSTTDGLVCEGNTYNEEDTVKSWMYSTNVDFYVHS